MGCIVHSPLTGHIRSVGAGFACAAAFVLAAAFACLLLPQHAIAAPSVGPGAEVTSSKGDAEASTKISVYVDSLRILGQTPDLAGSADELLGGAGKLQVGFSGGISPYTVTWTRTVDGIADASFMETDEFPDASSSATHAFKAGELVEGHEYVYKLSVTDGGGAEAQHAETAVRVVCSSDYGWRDGVDDMDEELGDDGYPQVNEPLYFHDETTGADIKVAGYMHRSARIVVTPLDEFDPTRLVLESNAGSALVTGAWVIEVIFEGGAPAGDLDPFVGDVHVSVRFPGQEAVRVASSNANVEGLRASVRVGETWSFPESVLFLGPEALVDRPECTVDEAREWLSFATDVLGAFATLGEKKPGAAHEVLLDVTGGGRVVPSPTEGGSWQVADGDKLRTVLLPDAGYTVGEVKASGGVAVDVSGNRVTLGPVTADCTLSVTFDKVKFDPAVLHTLSAEVEGGNGGIEPAEPVQVAHGASALVQFLPDAGYVVDQVLVNGQAVTPFADAYLVSAMTEDVHVSVSYRAGTPAPQAWFTVRGEVSSGEGSVSPTAAVVPMGGRATFSFLPADGWQVSDVLVNGDSVGAKESHVVESVTKDTLVEVAFEQVDPGPGPGPGPDNPDNPDNPDDPVPGDNKRSFTIRASSGAHGSVSPEGEIAVAEGADASFAFVPDTGFRVADVVVDGKSVGAPSTYTFQDVTADHTVHVEFQSVYDSVQNGSGTGGGSGSGGSGSGGATVKTGDMVGMAALGLLGMAVLAAIVVLIARRRGGDA